MFYLEIVLTEKDKFCENAILTTPTQSPSANETNGKTVEVPERKEIELHDQAIRYGLRCEW